MILEGNKSNTLPKIAFEEMSGLISITGRAVSPEIEEQFDIFIPYLKDCLSKYSTDINAHIDLEYFNTRATLRLSDLFKYLKFYKDKENRAVNIYWHYQYGDDDIIESGEDFEELSGLKFNFIEESEKD